MSRRISWQARSSRKSGKIGIESAANTLRAAVQAITKARERDRTTRLSGAANQMCSRLRLSRLEHRKNSSFHVAPESCSADSNVFQASDNSEAVAAGPGASGPDVTVTARRAPVGIANDRRYAGYSELPGRCSRQVDAAPIGKRSPIVYDHGACPAVAGIFHDHSCTKGQIGRRCGELILIEALPGCRAPAVKLSAIPWGIGRERSSATALMLCQVSGLCRGGQRSGIAQSRRDGLEKDREQQ